MASRRQKENDRAFEGENGLSWAHFFAASVLLGGGGVSRVLASQPHAGLLKAKQEAESRGYLFVTSHEEIVAGGKKEGKLRALSNLDRAAIKAMSEAFKKKYPFIDVHVEEIGGSEAFQRLVLEIKSGTVPDEWFSRTSWVQ